MAQLVQTGETHFLSFKEKLIYSVAQIPGGFFASILGQIQLFWYAWMGLQWQYIVVSQVLYALWNVINDPLFAILQDRTRTPQGRYIPWIKWSMIPLSVAFILVFIPPQGWRNQVAGNQFQLAMAAWYLVTQMFYDTFYTTIFIAHVSLLPQMTMNQKERTQVNGLKSLMTVSSWAIAMAIPIIFLSDMQDPAMIRSFQIVVIIIGIVSVIPWVLVVRTIKEHREFIPEKVYGIWESIKLVFKNPSGRIYILYDGFSVGFINIMITGIVFLFQWLFGLGNPLDPVENWGFIDALPYLAPSIVALFISVPFLLWVGRTYDVKKALFISLFAEAVGCFITFFAVLMSTNLTPDKYVVPSNLWLIAIGFAIVWFGIPGDFLFHEVMRSDTIDYDELTTGERRESIYAGVGCVFSKPMISVAIAGVTWIIAAFGLVPANPEDHIDTALKQVKGFDMATIGVAAAVFLFGGIVALLGIISWTWYPLDKKALKKMRKELALIHEEKRKTRLGKDSDQ